MKRGFTLAEVLITLAVIGVVAVLTVPNMMKSYQKQVSVTQLQKFYNQLRTAATNCMQEEMSDSLIGTTADRDPQAFIKKYLKPTSFFTDYTEGFGEKYGTLNDLEDDNYGISRRLRRICSMFVCATLETGLSMAISNGYSMSASEEIEKEDWEDGHGYIEISIDVNGKKGPNIAGRDFFGLRLYSDGVVGNSYMPDDFYNKNSCMEGASSYGDTHCFDYLKKSGWVMDY